MQLANFNGNNVFQRDPLIPAGDRRHHDGRTSEKPVDRHDRITWSALDMIVNEYTRLSPLQRCELIAHLRRTEQDIEERLTAREQQVRETGEDKPDPIRKRLSFLLLKQRRERRVVEAELATRENNERARSSSLGGDAIAASSAMAVVARDTTCLTDEHPDSAQNPRKTDASLHSTSAKTRTFESGAARTLDARQSIAILS